jgi:hypothetical protein
LGKKRISINDMPTGENKVHVSRNGSLLGVYEVDQLGDMLERGQLNLADQFYDEASGAWVPLSEWKAEEEAAPKFKQASDVPPSESGSRRRGGKSSKAKKRAMQGAMFGWIACLFALVVAAGIFGYAAVLQGDVHEKEKQIVDLNAKFDVLKRENQLLTEISPADRVRAIITYEPSANQVAIMSGATVGLYKRQDVEAALSKLSGKATDITASSESFDRGIEELKAGIPSPLEVTLTDSNGRVDLPVREPGEYVLVASAGKSTPSGLERYLWMVGFQASSQPSSLILMNEKNATSLRKPSFSIIDVPGMVSGTAP